MGWISGTIKNIHVARLFIVFTRFTSFCRGRCFRTFLLLAITFVRETKTRKNLNMQLMGKAREEISFRDESTEEWEHV